MKFRKMLGKLYRGSNNNEAASFPLRPPLPLPENVSESELYRYVTSIRVTDAPEAEMQAYASQDFRRFVYTLSLTNGLSGRCLELGANPYFTTCLLKTFTDLELELANYFGNVPNGEYSQTVEHADLAGTKVSSVSQLKYQHFNVENDTFPYPDNHFDVVIFAEIIEHLLNDPCKVLREIKRVLKLNGSLILTTPNVARLENVAKLIAGENIYDPYSGYGPYGRHNREYNRHELVSLLEFEGFHADQHLTADVHANGANSYTEVDQLKDLIGFRKNDLGQYIFVRARVVSKLNPAKRPAWLYRSYADSDLS